MTANGVAIAPLSAHAMAQFVALRHDAVSAVAERFFTTYAATYERFGARGREATREDLYYHVEFLRPVLEFGLLQPMVAYLQWLAAVLAARAVPVEHLVLSIEWLGEFYRSRMASADGEAVEAALRAVCTAYRQAGAPPTVSLEADQPWPEASTFEAALLAGDHRAARDIVMACLERWHRLVDVEMHVIQPALYAIGAGWQANRVSVAQEHMATAIAQSVMTEALVRAVPREATGQRVLLACVEGNQHALGLRMVADAFQLDGWEVRFLGANVPTASLVEQVVEWKPHLVGLSLSFEQHLAATRDVIHALAARLGDARPAVLIGGLAVNRFAPLTALVRADATALRAADAPQQAAQAVTERGRG